MGTKKVTSKNDFLRTRERYSRCIIRDILFMRGRLKLFIIRHLFDKDIVHGGNDFQNLVNIDFWNEKRKDVI